MPLLWRHGEETNNMSNRLPLKDRLRDHPMFADTSLRCKYCGELYDENNPPGPVLKGYCSEECKKKSVAYHAKKEALYKLYQEKLKEEWERREQSGSHRYDADQVRRKMPGGYNL